MVRRRKTTTSKKVRNFLLATRLGGLENFKNQKDALMAKRKLMALGFKGVVVEENSGFFRGRKPRRLGNTSVLLAGIKSAVKKRR